MKRIVLIHILLIGAMTLGCGKKDEKAHEAPKGPVVKVSVARVEKGELPWFTESVGTVKAVREATVASKVMGPVIRLNFREGDRVKEGTILVEIDDMEIKTQLQQGEAGVAEATAAYKNSEITIHRMKNLLEQKSATQQQCDNASMEHDMAKARVQQTNANMEALKVMLGYTKVSAPFDGVITEKGIEKGEMATPGRPLFKITDDTVLRLETEIRESDIKGIKAGKAIDVRVDAVDKVVRGKVSQIITSGDPSTHSFLVKIELPKTEGLLPGMFGRASLGKDMTKTILVPKSAVVEKGQLTGVFAVTNGVARFRMIKTGMTSGDKVEILSGLTEGEEVAISNINRLNDGSQVEIIK